ncbi:ATP-dependent DNA helicase [Mycena indigotica]|uniref:ATP-dependent DNA helicase n=1 Tax=Mycena indigotica TaxID=2126181 RepID=A0A8H6W288_9AGAR|nr:ATP-dependent DNA helicase [Mycena indigotica]KAF7298998.1 ATP-dependent DNA helicase [Mycena indigotica]
MQAMLQWTMIPTPDDVDDVADEAEERDFEDRSDLLPVHAVSEEDNVVDGEYPPAVFPLQPHGAIDVSGDSLNDQDLYREAVRNFMPPPKPQRRTENGRGPTNANHLLGTFPVLFPYGLGGLEVDRPSKVSYEEHVRWALQYDDGRFRKDLYFMFQTFGVQVKRQVCRSACLQLDFNTFFQNKEAFQKLTAEDFVKASKEEDRKQPISNPVIRAFRQQITSVRARVTGTDESRVAIRAQVWGMTLRFNPPSIWTTINFADTGGSYCAGVGRRRDRPGSFRGEVRTRQQLA